MQPDTEPEVCRGGPLSPNEAILALDFHANKAAKAGNYGMHDDLHAAADAMEKLVDRVADLELQLERVAWRTPNAELIFSSRYEPNEYRDKPPRDEDYQ